MRSRFRLSLGIIVLSFLILGILSFGVLNSDWLHQSQKVSGLVTLDAQSGKVLWSTPVNDLPPIRRTMTHNGQVYILAASRKESYGNWCIFPPPDVLGITRVTAFNAVSGKQLWQFKADILYSAKNWTFLND